MKVLYLTNIPAPYRVEFFSRLAERVDLTVTYEERKDGLRDDGWLERAGVRHEAVFLDDLAGAGDLARARAALRLARDGGFDLVVVGCYNSRVGVLSILGLKRSGRRYLVNVDGMYFPGDGLKKRVRDRLVAGADGYLVAGERTWEALRPVAGVAPVFPYRFSSLTRAQVEANGRAAEGAHRESFVLCVGQYEPYKGVDVLLDVARDMPERAFVLVGSGRRAPELCAAARGGGRSNVTVVDFLDAEALGDLYLRCAALVLPSRQECWGLVVNEALSYGATVVSTCGAGAAVELLGDIAPGRLSEPGDAASLERALRAALGGDPGEWDSLDRRLRERAAGYSIEAMAEDHVAAFDRMLGGSS